MSILLAGDVGGTKSLLALFAPERGIHAPIEVRVIDSGRFKSFDDVVVHFLDDTGARCKSAVLGVAGPVLDGRAVLTNLSWTIDASLLASRFGFQSVTLLNDLVATAGGLPVLTPQDLVTLQTGTADTRGTRAIIAPGTGLGQAFLTWDGDRYAPHPSEGGHCDFAPRSTLEVGLLRFLQQRFDHVSYERVCSGRGIPNIYDYLRDAGAAPEPEWLAAERASAPDLTPAIVRAALDDDPPSELCLMTLRVFSAVLAAEAGNLALTVLGTGGMYLAGGLPPRMLSLLHEPAFLAAFRGKGRMSEILERIPLHVVMRPDAALLGAAAQGLGALRREG